MSTNFVSVKNNTMHNSNFLKSGVKNGRSGLNSFVRTFYLF